MAGVVSKAVALCVQDTQDEARQFGCLPPSRQVSPLDNEGYSISEYAMMERDRGKYLLYLAALRLAVSDLAKKKPGKVRIAVLGCGRGRLIQFGHYH